jgi:hypothetical protein
VHGDDGMIANCWGNKFYGCPCCCSWSKDYCTRYVLDELGDGLGDGNGRLARWDDRMIEEMSADRQLGIIGTPSWNITLQFNSFLSQHSLIAFFCPMVRCFRYEIINPL